MFKKFEQLYLDDLKRAFFICLKAETGMSTENIEIAWKRLLRQLRKTSSIIESF